MPFEEVVTAVIQEYPGYRLDAVYRRSFKDGGLTILQIHTLYDHITKRRLEDLKFQCRIHGIDPDANQSPSRKSSQSEANSNVPLFGDPSQYEHMSQEERDALTARMMGAHKHWNQTKSMRTVGS